MRQSIPAEEREQQKQDITSDIPSKYVCTEASKQNISQVEMSPECLDLIIQLKSSLTKNQEKCKWQIDILKSAKDEVKKQRKEYSDICKEVINNLNNWLEQIENSQQMISESFEALVKFEAAKDEDILDVQSENLQQHDVNLNFSADYESIRGQLQEIETGYQKEWGIFNIEQLFDDSITFTTEINLFHKIIVIFTSQNIQRNQYNKQKLNYQLIHTSYIQQNQECLALAFNKDSTLMIAGCYSTIQIFSFNSEQIKLIQELYGHEENVLDLYFMLKNKDSFVSGSKDNTIRIWTIDNNSLWYCNQILKIGYKLYFYLSIIMNKDEDLIVSVGHGSIINFWIKNGQQQWELQYQLDFLNSCQLLGGSLNNSGNQLVTRKNNKIMIIEKIEEKQWRQKQTIENNDCYQDLLYIGDELIIASMLLKVVLYKMQNQQGYFIQWKCISIKTGRLQPIRLLKTVYNKSQSILILNNREYIIIIKIKDNDEFLTEQFIIFPTAFLSYALTYDGKYLVTWDNSSNAYSIRKQIG